ncbi:MAG: glycoside hydrolase family protein [Burkholderiaceae bacterium]|nr:glycoside hydrolase family protein [Burkholderiaceae bacterium]
MRLSDVGLAHLKSFEGLRLDAYPDPGSKDGLPITIGYGSTTTMGGAAWHLGDRITEAEAAQLLRRDAAIAEAAVNRLVHVPLTQAQFDALVSFAFNVGALAFESSTLLRKLNAGDYDGAAAEFDRWRFNDGVELSGLARRRKAEREMFESMPAPAEAATELVAEAPTPQQIAASPQSVPVEAQPMTPFIAAALPALVQSIPELIRSFGTGAVTERNARAAEAVLQVVQTATEAPNAQAAVEAIQSDPAALQAARTALEREMWFEATEAGGGGIDGARKADAKFVTEGRNPSDSPAFIISCLLLIFPAMLLVDALFIHGNAYDGNLRTQIVTGVLMVISMVGGFYLGSSFAARRQQ